MENALPRARRDGLLLEVVLDEIMIYDTRSDEVHCLNATAAAIWRACDGQTAFASLAAHVRETTGMPCDETVVWHGIGQFHERGLLDAAIAPPSGLLSRRALLERLGTAAVWLPLVTSIVAPTPAMAQSGSPGPQGPQGAQGPQGPTG